MITTINVDTQEMLVFADGTSWDALLIIEVDLECNHLDSVVMHEIMHYGMQGDVIDVYTNGAKAIKHCLSMLQTKAEEWADENLFDIIEQARNEVAV